MAEPLWMMGALREDDSPPSTEGRRRAGAPGLAHPAWALALWGGLLGLVLLCLYLWHAGAERRVVEALPREERAAALAQALERYRTLCGPQPSGTLLQECQRQASYLRLFPECGDACRALTRAATPRPSR